MIQFTSHGMVWIYQTPTVAGIGLVGMETMRIKLGVSWICSLLHLVFLVHLLLISTLHLVKELK